MNLVDIENMPFADLKSKRAELIEAARQSPLVELATRFVDARTDAKQRDEKLAEQGRTITSLNDSLDARVAELRESTSLIADLRRELSDANNSLNQQRAAAVAKAEEFEETIRITRTKLLAAESDCRNAEKLAASRRAALVDVMNQAAKLTVQVAPLLAQE